MKTITAEEARCIANRSIEVRDVTALVMEELDKQIRARAHEGRYDLKVDMFTLLPKDLNREVQFDAAKEIVIQLRAAGYEVEREPYESNWYVIEWIEWKMEGTSSAR